MLVHIHWKAWNLCMYCHTSHLQCGISTEIELTSWILASQWNSVWVAIMRRGHAVKHWYSACHGRGRRGFWASNIFIYNDKGWQMHSGHLSGHNEQRKTSNQALMANCNERQKRWLTLFFNYWLWLFAVQRLKCARSSISTVVITVCKRTGSILKNCEIIFQIKTVFYALYGRC